MITHSENKLRTAGVGEIATQALKTDGPRYFSRAIGNALSILKILQESHRALTLTEVTARAKLPKSSVFRILRTLEIAGCIEKSSPDRFQILVHGAGLLPQGDASRITAAAKPAMRQLALEHRETVSLAVFLGNRIEVTAVLDSPHQVRMGNVVGGIIPPHASSLGKCIAAFVTEEQRDRLIRCFGLMKMTPHTIADEISLQAELERVRERGYATDLEESALDGCCVAAPVFDHEGRPVAAISLSMPKIRFENPEGLVPALREAVQSIQGQVRAGQQS